MKVQHVLAERLRGADFLLGQFLRRVDAVYGPETPADGRAQHHALAVETEHRVAAADALRREPPKAEGLLRAVLRFVPVLERHRAEIQVRVVQIPPPGGCRCDGHFTRHHIITRRQFHRWDFGRKYARRRVAAVPGLLSSDGHLNVAVHRFLRGVAHRRDGVHLRDGRRVLHVDVIHIHGIARREPDASRDASKPVAHRDHVLAPRERDGVAPVEVATGVGHAHGKFTFLSGLHRIRDIHVKRRIANDI